MYLYDWDKSTRGYKLTTQAGRFIANEIRPVFAEELALIDLDKRFEYDREEVRPLLWAQKHTYLLHGERVAQLNNTRYGKPLSPEFFFMGKMRLEPVDIGAMAAVNAPAMDIIAADAKRRTKELYDMDIKRCDIAYIAFSGGKDSVALLDICHRVLPLSVPVIFSDTDMELPDTYKVWGEVQALYPEREFICARAEDSALENWRRFAPPSRTIRWCCSVHKSTPALMLLKDKLRKPAIKAMAFVGVRGDEGYSRSFYTDRADGVKNASQLNRMPILDWGAHELWLYIFANNLLINRAYKKGISRVGCILCPESSDKHLWYVNKVYPQSTKPYNDVIIETSTKYFKNTLEKNEFIGRGSWQARCSGVVLRETLSRPLEQHVDLKVVFQSLHFTKSLFYEWIKTIGTVVKDKALNCQRLKLPNTFDNGIPFTSVFPYAGGGTAIFEFQSEEEKTKLLPILRACLRKVLACVACRACEAECSVGAITTKDGRLKVNSAKCTKCRACYEIENSCLRFYSMREPEKTQSAMVKIHSYKTFGLQEVYVSVLMKLGGDFFPWNNNHPLGKNMVPAARNWFLEARLIYENSKTPSLLLEIFKQYGVLSPLGWEFVWISLANNSILIKWYISSTDIDISYTSEQFDTILKEGYPSLTASVIDGGLQSLKSTFKNSPLGGNHGVAVVEMRGKTVKSITRKAKEVSPLTILYGLYLIAAKADRETFTVRELMAADVESAYISPMAAFGITPDTFKKQCEGLKSRYPDYIDTTFTHGNDELTVFPKKHTPEDIIRLTIKE